VEILPHTKSLNNKRRLFDVEKKGSLNGSPFFILIVPSIKVKRGFVFDKCFQNPIAIGAFYLTIILVF
jgi:hypothetical protein